MEKGLADLRLKPDTRQARVLRGHPWVFANEVKEPLPPELDGKTAGCRDAGGRFLGSGIYNSRSKIIWRRFSSGRRNFGKSYLREAITAAINRRGDEPCRRLVWSEADSVPGLVADQYGDILVLQALTLAADRSLPLTASIFQELLRPREILFRNDAPARRREGLPLAVSTLSGRPLAPSWRRIGGIEYWIDFMNGQKTGFYLDQRRQHTAAAAYAPGRRVLDGFCHQGAFALSCAAAGAASVLGVENSSGCAETARKNAGRNSLAAEFRCANMFDFFTQNRNASFDLIILDPPSFARNKASLPGALRGYKELNLRALRMLTPGGILMTYSCSQRASRAVFMQMLAEAAHDIRRPVQVLAQTGQPPDHPVRLNFPESEYLKGAHLRVI